MRPPQPGETGVYFVESLVRRQIHPLLGWTQGHFLVESSTDGIEHMTTVGHKPVVALDDQAAAGSSAVAEGAPLGATVAEKTQDSHGLSYPAFREKIEQQLASDPGMRPGP